MAPYWVCRGRKELQRDLKVASSRHLEQLQAALPVDRRVANIVLLEDVRKKLVEYYLDKFAFGDNVHWKALGVFYVCCGGTLEESKLCLTQCLAEYDSVMAGPSGGKNLHRVAHLMFHPSTACRRQLEAFFDHGERLEDFPAAFILLQEYALTPLVERQVEGMHSIIKRLCRAMPHVLPPYLCARMRESSHMLLLRMKADFYKFCIQGWNKPSLLNECLALRCSPSALASMSRTEKIKHIYHSSLESMFEDTADAKQSKTQWLAVTADTRMETITLPKPLSLGEDLLRGLFINGDVFFYRRSFLIRPSLQVACLMFL